VIRVSIVGMPELDAAIKAGQVRGELHVPLSARGLGVHAIELAADEEIVARTPLTFEENMLVGEAILIAKRTALPRLKIAKGDPRLTDLARVLTRGAARS
jgi:hypothetical protein